MTRGVPSDQSQGCLVSSHRYNECHYVLVTFFPALTSHLASRLRTCRVSGHERVKIGTTRYIIGRFILKPYRPRLVLSRIKYETIFFQITANYLRRKRWGDNSIIDSRLLTGFVYIQRYDRICEIWCYGSKLHCASRTSHIGDRIIMRHTMGPQSDPICICVSAGDARNTTQ